MRALSFRRVPGLLFYENAISSELAATLQKLADDLAGSLAKLTDTRNTTEERVRVPQPIRSAQHNLAEERSFYRHALRCDGKEVRCEHFLDYGGPGHALTYFQHNKNIPPGVEPLLEKLEQLPEVGDCTEPGGTLDWRLTMNHYSGGVAKRVAFPWHTDIATNGQVTAIFTLGSPGRIEFAASREMLRSQSQEGLPTEEDPESLLLKPLSLLTVTGPARWDYMHRVHGSQAKRTSLVLGCTFKRS